MCIVYCVIILLSNVPTYGVVVIIIASGNGVRHIDEFTVIRPARLILGWVTVHGYTVICNQPPRPTQPSTLSGMGSEYRPKCGDGIQLGSKGRYGLIIPFVDKRVDGRQNCNPWLTRAVPEHFRDELLMIKRYVNIRVTSFTEKLGNCCCRTYKRLRIAFLRRH